MGADSFCAWRKEKIDFTISIHVGFFFLAYLKMMLFFFCLSGFIFCFVLHSVRNNLSSLNSGKNKLYSVSNCVSRDRAIAIKNQDRQYKKSV